MYSTKKLASPIAGKIFSLTAATASTNSMDWTDGRNPFTNSRVPTFEAAFLTNRRISHHATYAVELPLPTTTPVPQSQQGINTHRWSVLQPCHRLRPKTPIPLVSPSQNAADQVPQLPTISNGDKQKKAATIAWTKEEDEHLLDMVFEMKHPLKWSVIAQNLGTNRTGKQCRLEPQAEIIRVDSRRRLCDLEALLNYWHAMGQDVESYSWSYRQRYQE
jgi:hypothetical protein